LYVEKKFSTSANQWCGRSQRSSLGWRASAATVVPSRSFWSARIQTNSEILAGKREMNRKHIEALARHFHVNPTVFMSV
jgi:hypothetical protein